MEAFQNMPVFPTVRRKRKTRIETIQPVSESKPQNQIPDWRLTPHVGATDKGCQVLVSVSPKEKPKSPGELVLSETQKKLLVTSKHTGETAGDKGGGKTNVGNNRSRNGRGSRKRE